MSTKRSLNYCNDCSNTWYPRGRDLSNNCPRCGSSDVTYAGCFGKSSGCVGAVALSVIAFVVLAIYSTEFATQGKVVTTDKKKAAESNLPEEVDLTDDALSLEDDAAEAESTDDPVTSEEVVSDLDETEPDSSETEFRTWRTFNRKFSVKAKFVLYVPSTVHLQRKDTGKEIEVPVSKLSTNDRHYIDQEQKTKSRNNSIEDSLESTEGAFRKWESANGQSSVEARFIMFTPGKVYLERYDTGEKISVPFETLSAMDQLYVEDR